MPAPHDPTTYARSAGLDPARLPRHIAVIMDGNGRREGLPADVLAELDENIQLSRDNTGLTLCLAINYGGRTEIADACRAIAERVRRGELDAAAIDEDTVSASLYTAGMPDPDLLIRTAGGMRVSNYLLWQ